MNIKKTIIKGKKGNTVCYQLKEFAATGEPSCVINWESFDFYSPLGNQTDDSGHTYFTVPGISEIIEKDDTLDKDVLFKVTQTEGIEIIEILEGASPPYISVGLNGDIVCTVFVPADPQENIQIEYKEVTDG